MLVLIDLCKALNTEQWSDGEPAEAEKDFWEIAAMEAYNHLMEWKSLQYCSTVYIDEASPPDLEKMWAEPTYQVWRRISATRRETKILLKF